MVAELSRAASPLTPGQVLEGKYRVVRPLGGGAMGLVYEGYHELLEKPVAIKVLRPELAQMEEGRDRFEAEARAAAAVGHPNIVGVTDLGRTPDGSLYFVMDLLRGETLGQRLERHGRIGVPGAIAIALDVLDGLAALHALALVHRDIKPDNIFLARPPAGREIAKILDFGIAKAMASVGRRSKGTSVGMAVGTPHYMAPEQAMAAPDLDLRVDLYAMGVVLYEALSGRRPFDAPDPVSLLAAVVTVTPVPLASLCPQAPPALVRIIEAAMSRVRERRPSSAGELAARLRALGTDPHADGGAEAAGALDLRTLDALEDGVLVDLTGNEPPAAVFVPAPPPGRAEPDPLPATRLVEATPAPAPAPAAPPAERVRPRRRALWLAPLPPLALALYLLLSRSKGAPPAATDPQQALVRFEVSPVTSRLFLDGLPLARNPVPLGKGERHVVTAVADGYQMVEQAFLVPQTETVVPLTLERARRR